MYQDCLFCKNNAELLWTRCMFNIENLEITVKYEEEYFACPATLRKPMFTFCFSLSLFIYLFIFAPVHISLFALFLMVLPRRAIKKDSNKCRSPLWSMSQSFHLERIFLVEILQKSFWKRVARWFSLGPPPKDETTWEENMGRGLGFHETVVGDGETIPGLEAVVGQDPELGTLLMDSLIWEILECLQLWGCTKNIHGSWSQREKFLGGKAESSQ